PDNTRTIGNGNLYLLLITARSTTPNKRAVINTTLSIIYFFILKRQEGILKIQIHLKKVGKEFA
ncbi:MAG TPA: hypothetical protein VNS50_05805, partial [Ginsengibacter sp.]|nr:hypothetical protein [Ginsengibacter sp.]